MKDNIIFVFPGQGVQNVGMGAEIWRDFASARYAYEMVSDILKTDIVKINDTVITPIVSLKIIFKSYILAF